MSGWLAVSSVPDASRWSAALRARPEGESVEEWRAPAGGPALAAWRRPSAEFPGSGSLAPSADGASCAVRVGLDLGTPAEPNGCFALAEAGAAAIRLRTDRHRQVPVWIWRGPGLLAASTDWACLLALVERPRIDRAALDFFVRCGELLGRSTLLEGVECMEAGTLIEAARDGGVSERRLWRLEHRGRPEIGFREAAAEGGRRLVEAVRRIERTGMKLVVPLSGGLDSRFVLGACERPDRVPSITWGTPGCRDLRYAARFAASVASPHEEHPFEPEAYPALWEGAVRSTAGCFVLRDMYVLPFVPKVARLGDVMLNGLAGDAMLGGNFLKTAWLAETDLGRLARTAWRWRVSESEERLIEGLVASDGPPPAETWERSVLARAGGGRPVETLVDWLFDNRVFRFTNAATALFRRTMEAYAPFFDRDLVDYLVQVPLEHRFRHRLYLRVIREACPAAGRVPWQRTALPPSWGYGALVASLAAHRSLRALGRWTGIDLLGAQKVASPADWFRGAWKEALRPLVLDGALAGRGLVRPEAVRRVWDTHQAGADCSRALGALAAAELCCRRFLDRLPVPAGADPA